MKYHLICTLITLFYSFIALSQTGEIQGKVIDPELGEGLPFVTVSVLVNGSIVGAQTDFDGYYSIKPLAVGEYTLSIKYVGYSTKQIENIIVKANKITFQDIEMKEPYFCWYPAPYYYQPNLYDRDDTSTGQIFLKKDIKRRH